MQHQLSFPVCADFTLTISHDNVKKLNGNLIFHGIALILVREREKMCAFNIVECKIYETDVDMNVKRTFIILH
jgi:hypothetical protein